MNPDLQVTIGDLAETIRGVTYQKSQAKDIPCDGYSPLIRATNIDRGTIVLDSFIYVPDIVIRDDQRLRPGDIVLAASSGSLSIVGKAALLRSEWRGTFGAFCYAIRPDPRRVTPGYLAYFMQTSTYRGRVSRLAAGVNINNLRREHIESVVLPICALAEQKRIVDAVDSYLTRLDNAIASLERVQAKLKAYRASVLKAAVEGRLVPTEASLARAEKRDYEPAEALLTRILKERRRRWEEAQLVKIKAKGSTPKDDRWKAKYHEPTPSESSTLPALPEGWCWMRAEAFFWDADYGTSEKCTLDGTGSPVLRIPNVDTGRISLEELKYAAKDADLKRDGGVEPGDFLFIRTNGSRSLIGRGALVVRSYEPSLQFASYLIRLRVVEVESAPAWFALAWHGPSVRTQLLKVAASSAGQHNVSLSAASSFVVPLPPVGEQSRILAEVDRLASVATKAEEQTVANLHRCRRLRQAVLKWAFEGNLVDQDPSDEPAEMLLARIRAERASAGPATKNRGRKAKGTV